MNREQPQKPPQTTIRSICNWILTLLPLGVFLLVLGLWYFVGHHPLKYADKDHPIEPGTYGDMFGGVNALFSGLAFAGLIYAIYLQSQELKLQRQELERTRDEFEKTRLEHEKTAEAQAETAKALTAQIKEQQAQVWATRQAAKIQAYAALLQSVNDDLSRRTQSSSTNPDRGFFSLIAGNDSRTTRALLEGKLRSALLDVDPNAFKESDQKPENQA